MTTSEEPSVDPDPVSKPRGQALVLHTIALAEEPAGDFESVMLDVVFPAVNTGDDNHPDEHTLLQDGHPMGQYTWASVIGYDIHHTPVPTWLTSRPGKAAAEAAPHLDGIAEIVESSVHFNVAKWRAIVGPS